MADDYIIKITYSFDMGNVASEATEAGQQAGSSFSTSFINNLKATNIAAEIEKAFSGVRIDRSSFGKNLQQSVEQAVKTGISLPAVAGAAAGIAAPVSRQEALARSNEQAAALSQQLTPLVTSLKAFGQLMQGAPLMAVASMAGDIYSQLERQAAATADRRIYFRGGQPGETEEARIRRRLPAAPGAAEAEAAEAETGFLPGVNRLFSRGPLAVAGAGVALLTGVDAAIVESGVSAANTAKHYEAMRKTFGMTRREFIDLGGDFAKSGLDVEEFNRSLYRLAISAQRNMPTVQKEMKFAEDEREEASIKRRESASNLAKAFEEQQASTEGITKAEGELLKVQQTGDAQREQRGRAAALAVTGAQIGVRGAELRAREAAVQLQFAPEQQRLEDIRGPLTVEGARLGRAGAGIALEEAAARFRRRAFGEEEDPDAAEMRQQRKDRLALQIALHNRDEADLKEREAQVAEQKRIQMPRPVERAQQAVAQAGLAEQEAKLRSDQAQTAQQTLTISQTTNTQQMALNDAMRHLADAYQKQADSGDKIRLAQDELARRVEDERRAPLRDPRAVQRIIRGEERAPSGTDIRDVPPDRLRAAVFEMGGFTAKGIMDAVSQIFKSPEFKAIPQTQQEAAMSVVLRNLGLMVRGAGGGEVDLQKLGKVLSKERSELTPEDEEFRAKVTKQWDEFMSSGLIPKISETRGVGAFQRGLISTFDIGPETAKRAPEAIKELNDFMIQLERGLAGLTRIQIPTGEEIVAKWKEAVGQGAENAASAIVDAGQKGATGITQAGSDLAAGIRNVIEQIGRNIAGQPGRIPGGEAAEVPGGQQAGGLMRGEGGPRDDKIPAMLSDGEYVVNAEQTSKHLSLLERINAGKFADGGIVPTADERLQLQRMGIEVSSPQGQQMLAFWRRNVPTHAGHIMPISVASIPIMYGAPSPPEIKRMPRPELDVAVGETPAPPAIRYADVGPTIGGVTPVLPPAKVETPLGPGDYDIKRGGRGDTNYFGDRDYAIPASQYPGAEDIERSTGGLIRRLFAGGGAVGRRIDLKRLQWGGSVSGGPYTASGRAFEKYPWLFTPQGLGQAEQEGAGIRASALADLAGRLGSVGAGVIGSVRGYASGGQVVSAAGGGGMSALSYHQLDIRTNAGNFPAAVSEEAMEGIRRSSLGGKLSQTGQRPTWYS